MGSSQLKIDEAYFDRRPKFARTVTSRELTFKGFHLLKLIWIFDYVPVGPLSCVLLRLGEKRKQKKTWK